MEVFSKISLSLIILNYRSEKFCHQSLLSIQKFPPSVLYEIILVDNASADESFENLKKVWSETLPLKFLALPKNIGYGQGNAAGIALSQGEFIAIVNPDISVEKGVFDGLLDFLKTHEAVGLVAPRLLSPDGTLQDSFRHFPTFFDLFIKRLPLLKNIFAKRLQHFLMWDIDLEMPSPVDWVVGAFFVMRKKAYEAVGGFDPRYFLFLEDTDLCRSLWEKDWQVIFHPGFAVEHYHVRLSQGTSVFDIFRKKSLRIHFLSAIKYFWKWRGRKF